MGPFFEAHFIQLAKTGTINFSDSHVAFDLVKSAGNG